MLVVACSQQQAKLALEEAAGQSTTDRVGASQSALM
jgi:hypothetical protein